MKIHISISLDADESAAIAENLDATLATVDDGNGNRHSLCAARGAITVALDKRAITITPNDYEKSAPTTETATEPKKKKGFFRR